MNEGQVKIATRVYKLTDLKTGYIYSKAFCVFQNMVFECYCI
jgi:hypothetical protein